MIRLLLIIVAVAASLAAEPAAVLSGRVVGPDGSPVAGAVVVVGDATALTDAAGRFSLSGMTPGPVRVSVSPPSAELAGGDQRISISAAGATEVEIELEAMAEVRESIVVTGTGSKSLLSEAPVRTELISSDLVDKQVKTTLTEALTATVPGVRIETNCQNCGTNQVRINGLEGGYTQILEDSLPSYSGVASIYGLDQMPTSFIEQVEIVKGGNSALYGPNAVAGVINLISREPRDFYFRVDAQTGWHRGRPETQQGAAAQLVDLPGGFSVDLYYRGIRRTHIDRDRDGFTELPRRNLQAGGGSLYKRFFSGAAQLRVTGTTADEFRRGGSQLDLRPENTYVTEQLESGRSLVGLRWQHSVSPTTYYNLSTSFSYLGRASYYGVDFDPNAYGFTRNPLWVNDAQVGRTSGAHTVIAGFQFQREYVDDAIPAYNRAFDDLFTNAGVYLQDEIRLNPRLTVIGGFRADKSNAVDRWIFSPRGSLKLGLTDNLVWRAGVSTGFRAPVIFDEDLHIASVGGEGFLVQRGEDLREEKSVSIQSGLDYLGKVGERRYELGAGFFWTTLDNNHQLDEIEVEGFRQLVRVNGAGSFVRGVDLSGSIDMGDRFSVRAGMTFQLARFEEPEPQFGSLRFFRTPNRYGFLSIDAHLPREWELILTGDYTGSMLAEHYAGFIPEDRLETTRSFFVPSLVLSRLFELSDRTKMRWFLSLRNVTDQYQPDLDRGPLRDSSYVYGPSQMRQATIGTTIEF